MEESTSCSKCNSPLTEEDKFCSNCGYPERGTTAEKNKYNLSVKLKKDVVDDAKKKLKNVKILLFVVAGINVIVGIVQLMDAITFNDGIGSLITAAVFLGCVIWVNNQPLTGILAAFSFWVLLQLSVVLIDPTLLLSGLFLKIVIIGIFIKGISSARDAKKYAEQLKEMKAI